MHDGTAVTNREEGEGEGGMQRGPNAERCRQKAGASERASEEVWGSLARPPDCVTPSSSSQE